MRESPGPGYWVSAYQNLSISYNGSQIVRNQNSVISDICIGVLSLLFIAMIRGS